MTQEPSAGFPERIEEMLAQSEKQMMAMQDQIAELVDRHWKAQQKTITDMSEQQQRSAKLPDQWEAQRKAITDQIERQWKARQKAISDMLERQWDAQKKVIEEAQNRLGGMFRPKPE